jgi:hypothetical protein
VGGGELFAEVGEVTAGVFEGGGHVVGSGERERVGRNGAHSLTAPLGRP